VLGFHPSLHDYVTGGSVRKTTAYFLLAWFCCSQLFAQTWVHPGVLVSNRQLDYVRAHLDHEPWKSALAQAQASKYAALNYQPHPHETVECGPYSKPDLGCSDETNDATAAYTQALLSRYTGNKQYATNAINILNAWANTLKGGHTNANGPLQASWAAELFARAADIMKYNDPDWTQTDKDKVNAMFRQQYLPDIQRMFVGRYACDNGNWDASGIEAMLNIAVYSKDARLFNDAVAKWEELVPAYIYLTSDGARPRTTSWCPRNAQQLVQRWYAPSVWRDGLAQETCRDLEHTAYGLAAIINAAETARLNGVDLYTKEAARITQAMEFHARFQNGSAAPALSCGSDQHDVVMRNGMKGTLEIGYNEYAIRRGMSLPETEKFLQQTRPAKGEFHYRWETLTHGLTGNANAAPGSEQH
jgi:hypothetical protein